MWDERVVDVKTKMNFKVRIPKYIKGALRKNIGPTYATRIDYFLCHNIFYYLKSGPKY